VKIVADENVDKDQTVLDRSLNVDGVLVTADKDFGDLVFRQRLLHSGLAHSTRWCPNGT
jgi:predicted nuclease of predicted toxin-antitoxin system